MPWGAEEWMDDFQTGNHFTRTVQRRRSSQPKATGRARYVIEQHPFPHRECQPGGALTASMGIATYPADGTDARSLVRHADQAIPRLGAERPTLPIGR